MTVVSLNFVWMQVWMKWSVLMSTFEVASSKTKNLFFFNKALAKHSNCFWPTEKTYEMFVMSYDSLLGN